MTKQEYTDLVKECEESGSLKFHTNECDDYGECESSDFLDELTQSLCGDRMDVHVENFGWQNRSGDMFDMSTVNSMVAILPNTCCNFSIMIYEDRIELNNSHHDKPTGGEIYKITPHKE